MESGKTKIFIHVGPHKTGTTFLQKEVFPKIKDINYVLRVAIDTPIVEGKVNLLSDENLDGGTYRVFRTVGNQRTIAKNLHGMFPNAKIIICLRNKDKWLQSAWKQYSVAYYAYPFKKYCELLDEEMTDFEAYAEFLKTLFKDVYICHYEDLVLNPEKFVKDLCDYMGVETPKFENKIVYPSITDGQLKFLQTFDKIFRLKVIHFVLSLCIKFVRKDEMFSKFFGKKV